MNTIFAYRMVTIIRRQNESLKYLEEVRQHMSRLPAIDPNTRTLLVCGFPNVGKSSFINKVIIQQVYQILSFVVNYLMGLKICLFVSSLFT